MNPLAEELNGILRREAPELLNSLSHYGEKLFFPKGILAQTQEASTKAHKFNATIGIAKEGGDPMHLRCCQTLFDDHFKPSEVYPYASSYGHMELRQLWAAHQKERNPGLNQSTCTLPIVTNGLTHGLSVAGQLFIDPDDTVLLSDKLWGNYRMIFGNKLRGQLDYYKLFDSQLKKLNTKSIEEKLRETGSQKTILILNFPNNPTGYTPSQEEAHELCKVLQQHAEQGKSLVVICDDAYFGMFYEKNTIHHSIFSDLVNLHPNITAVKIDGCTKELFMWGFRVGFITIGSLNVSQKGLQAFEKKIGGAVRSDISNVSTLSQNSAIKVLRAAEFKSETLKKAELLERRYRKAKIAANLKKYENLWKVYPFNSGYFLCLQILPTTSEAVRLHLLEQHGVGTISINGHDLRVAFSCIEEHEIEEMFELIGDSVKSLASH